MRFTIFHLKSNTGYYAKSLCLVLAMGSLFFPACGDDEKQLDLMTPEVPALEEQLVGSWEIISEDGATVEEAFEKYFGDKIILEEADDVEITLGEMFFATNGSVFLNFRITAVAKYVIAGDVATVSTTTTVAGKGTYTLSGSTLTTVWEDALFTLDSLELEPEDLWASDGATEQGLEESFNEANKEGFNLGLEIENSDLDLSSDTLTLTDDEGSNMVLKKR